MTIFYVLLISNLAVTFTISLAVPVLIIATQLILNGYSDDDMNEVYLDHTCLKNPEPQIMRKMQHRIAPKKTSLDSKRRASRCLKRTSPNNFLESMNDFIYSVIRYLKKTKGGPNSKSAWLQTIVMTSLLLTGGFMFVKNKRKQKRKKF